jgi:hypothetical protein
MAALTVNQETRNSSIAPTPEAADAGLSDTFYNNGRTRVLAVKSSSGAVNLTISAANFDVPGAFTVSSQNISVPGDGLPRILGPFDPGKFNSSSGLVTITCADSTDLTYVVFSE